MDGGVTGDGDDMSATPPNPDDVLSEIKTRWKEANAKREVWLKDATEAYGFDSGSGHWSEDDKQVLKDTGNRPVVTFNRVGPIVDVVCGLEIGNRQEIRYIPREKGDVKPNEVLTAGAKWVRDECQAEDEESSAFRDMVITGEGWVNTRLEYEYNLDGAIIQERIDPREIVPDPASVKTNYADAEYLFREKDVPFDWVKKTWPDKADEMSVSDPSSDDEELGEPHKTTKGDQYAVDQGSSGRARGRVKLIEYQRKIRKPVVRVADPLDGGKLKKVTPEEYEKLKVAIPGLKGVKQTDCEVWRAFKVGETLLEDMKCPDPRSFTYKAMTAKRDMKSGQWYGLVRGAQDPQRWANKFLSQSMHVMNANAKGGVVVEKSALNGVKPNAFEESWADPTKISIVADGALSGGRIQPKQPPAFPPQLADLMTFAITSIRDVTGVSIELLGMADRQQAASLELQRRQSGVTILATFFDSLRRYRKEQGRTLLYLITTYISDGRLIRIVGKGMEQYIPLVRDQFQSEYDVIVDEAPTSPNQKERVWAVLQTLIPMMMQAGIAIPDEVLDYLPLPQSLIDAARKPKDDPNAQAAMEMKKRADEAQIGKVEADAAKAKAEAMKAQREAQPTGREAVDTASALADADQKTAQNMAMGIPRGISMAQPQGMN